MAQISLTTSATILPFNRMLSFSLFTLAAQIMDNMFCMELILSISGGANQWTKLLFPCFPKRYGTNFALFASSRTKGVRFVGSGATGKNGSAVEISEAETVPRSYVWPDKKVALLCLIYLFIVLSKFQIQLYLLKHVSSLL